jgi:hypothetical protein
MEFEDALQLVVTDDGWSPWFDLRQRPRLDALLHPGIYRVRSAAEGPLVYVGQTGRTLRERLAALARGLAGPVMPLRDPHTAAPALWAMRRSGAVQFEASVLALPGLTTPDKKAIEAVVTALHRARWQCSPAANFGRMPLGWSMSSPNNTALRRQGRVAPGRATDDMFLCHLPGVPPGGPLTASGMARIGAG